MVNFKKIIGAFVELKEDETKPDTSKAANRPHRHRPPKLLNQHHNIRTCLI